ncbi:MAG: tRNA (N6-isopentenyl adenosine(37)-C2)-methylthiotransferase MiaB, partial [Clostridia bacterium]|nr:tRNA (N6-isopentenyl adenosine(37)-C2)-methylthiotransferase MiaB [Clostridia bacterium]
MNAEILQEEIRRQHAVALSLREDLRGKKALVRTFGCQQNEADGERIAGELVDCGYTMTDELSEADLVILNTCAVREHAENRVLGIIGSIKKEKEKRPDLKIGMCGCMAQEPHRQEQLRRNYPYVDLLFGTDRLHLIPEMIRDMLGTENGGKRKGPKQKQYVSELPHGEFGVITEETPVVRTSS